MPGSEHQGCGDTGIAIAPGYAAILRLQVVGKERRVRGAASRGKLLAQKPIHGTLQQPARFVVRLSSDIRGAAARQERNDAGNAMRYSHVVVALGKFLSLLEKQQARISMPTYVIFGTLGRLVKPVDDEPQRPHGNRRSRSFKEIDTYANQSADQVVVFLPRRMTNVLLHRTVDFAQILRRLGDHAGDMLDRPTYAGKATKKRRAHVLIGGRLNGNVEICKGQFAGAGQ